MHEFYTQTIRLSTLVHSSLREIRLCVLRRKVSRSCLIQNHYDCIIQLDLKKFSKVSSGKTRSHGFFSALLRMQLRNKHVVFKKEKKFGNTRKT